MDASYNLTGWCGHCEGPAVGTSNWQFFSASYVAPANAAYVRYFAELHGCGDPDTSVTSADFDDAFLNVGGVYYQFADALGSTRAVTDSSGNLCFSADYYPYGQENDYNTSCSPTYKFAGYEYDSETGNYYAYARYYNPRLGRFMSPDPLGGSVDDPQSLNGYSYVLNNPATLNDPLGLVAVCMVAGRGGQGDFAAGGGGGGLPNCDYGPTEGGGSWGGGGGSFYSGGGECSLDGGDVPCGELGSLAPPNSVYDFIGCSDSASCAALTLGVINQEIDEEGYTGARFGLLYPTPIGIGGDQTEPQVPTQQQCEAKIQSAVNGDLHVQSVYLGVAPGMDSNGMRGGAYNFDFFAPGVYFAMPPGPGSVPGAACGRFTDGLHIPVPGGLCNLSGDPTTSNWGPGVYNGVPGSFFTAHIDSADPFQDVWSFLAHIFTNVILQEKHGC